MPKSLNFEAAEAVLPDDRSISEVIDRQAQFYWVPRGDVKLRVMLATPEADEPRGTLIFCPGRTEFIEKYFETIEDFLASGFTVLIMDPRGQGLSSRLVSDPLKSYVRDFQDYAEDMAFVSDAFAPLLPKPHIAMGHSMGGCVALQAIISGVMNPAAVVCSAPMLGLFDVETSVMSSMIKLASKLGFSKHAIPFQKQQGGIPVAFKSNKLTSDLKRFESWAAYFRNVPELRVGPPTFAWICAALKSMAYVNRNADQLKVPGLIIAAGGDPIVDPASNQRFAKNAGITYRVVPGALHEVFLEQDHMRSQFFEAFDHFLKENGL